MSRFELIFNKYINKNEYKYNPKKSLNWNESHLKRMAFLENSARALYEKLDSTFGEAYAEFILTRVLKKDFTITSFELFPFADFNDTSGRILLYEYLNRSPLKSDGNIGVHNLISFYTSAIREIISATKHQQHIELYDFFICLGLMIEKWVITEYPKYITKRQADVETLLKQFVKHLVYALYAKEGDIQTITLSILDKKCFEECIKLGDYTVVIDKDTGERITATYEMYMNALRIYFDLVQGTKNSQELLQPAIRTYAFASNKIKPEFLETVAHSTGVDIGVISDIFKHVNFDAHPQCLSSPEFLEAFEKLETLKVPRKNVNYIQLKGKLKVLFETDYINYLNVVCRELAYFLDQRELEKNVPSYETIYLKKVWDIFSPKQKGIFSEVIIDYKYVSENCQSKEEYKERLYKAVLDAQAINQMRVSLLYKAGRKPTSVLNVKLDGCDDDMISYSYSVMSEAIEYLKTTYQLPFTFDISQRIFFRDKSRTCYLIL